MVQMTAIEYKLTSFLDDFILFYNYVRLKTYRSVRLTKTDLKNLPKKSGVYFVVRKGEVIYVGLSKNLRSRWNAKGTAEHKVISKLKENAEINGCRLYYRSVPKYNLDYIERLEILRFNPKHNVQYGDPAKVYNWRSRLHDMKLIFLWAAFSFVIGFSGGLYLIYG